MTAYYFHCTDGYELILDRAGRRMRSPHQAELVAHTVAGRVMRAVREGVGLVALARHHSGRDRQHGRGGAVSAGQA